VARGFGPPRSPRSPASPRTYHASRVPRPATLRSVGDPRPCAHLTHARRGQEGPFLFGRARGRTPTASSSSRCCYRPCRWCNHRWSSTSRCTQCSSRLICSAIPARKSRRYTQGCSRISTGSDRGSSRRPRSRHFHKRSKHYSMWGPGSRSHKQSLAGSRAPRHTLPFRWSSKALPAR
jgi:hypothetical protein